MHASTPCLNRENEDLRNHLPRPRKPCLWRTAYKLGWGGCLLLAGSVARVRQANGVDISTFNRENLIERRCSATSRMLHCERDSTASLERSKNNTWPRSPTHGPRVRPFSGSVQVVDPINKPRWDRLRSLISTRAERSANSITRTTLLAIC